MLETRETLASLRAAEHYHMLRKTAEELLWDWSAAEEIMRQTWAKAEANFDQFDPELRPLASWVWNNIRLRLVMDYCKANGYWAPLTEQDAQLLYDDQPEEIAAIRAERGALIKRINALPPTFREALHAWLRGRSVDPATGVRVRVGLKLLNRRAA